VTKGVDEPYRMFTSRAEYRLLLRHDNADRRLTPIGRRIRLVTDDAWQRLERKEQVIAKVTDLLRNRRNGPDPLERVLRRPDVDWARLCDMEPSLKEWSGSLSTEYSVLSTEFARAIEQVELEAKYAGYIERQAAQVERFQRLESKPIPAHFDYTAVPQLRAEAKEKLSRIRPQNLGQASRISGISPADLAVVLIYLNPRPQGAQPVAACEKGDRTLEC